MLVIKKNWVGCVILALTWVVSFLHDSKGEWKGELKPALFRVVTSLRVPVLVLSAVFLVHLFAVTPYKRQSVLIQATNVITKPSIQEIRVDVADKELRQQFTNDLSALRDDNKELQTQLQTARRDAAELRGKLVADQFVPLAADNRARFLLALDSWFKRWPAFTNFSLISDATEKSRRLWIEQMMGITENKLPIQYSAGMNADRGFYDLVIFSLPEHQQAAKELATPFVNLFKPPILISTNHNANATHPISVRFMGKPLFDTNGVIYFAVP